MVKIYYKGSCNSSQKVILWFTEHGIDFEKSRISQLSRKELLNILSLTNEGIDTLIKKPGKVTSQTKNQILKISEMTFNEGINFLNVNPNLLHTPIVIDGKKLMIGFNREEIRQFIPRGIREGQRLIKK